MKCPKCQFKNSEEIHFCGKCGSALKESAESTAIECLEPQSYTPKFLADKILTSRSSIEGERKLVTVLFADVANYTSMSEKLDPEVVHQIMDGCFKILMDEIHTFKGTINQFTGDGVMALFGAPIALEDHAQKACHAALAIQETIKKYSKRINNKYGVDFKIRIGLNSGPVVVGAIGDDLRMDYTAVGDTTNLSARMESLAKPGTVLISHNTYTWIGQQFVCKSLGRAEMKGKEESQEIYELIKDKVYRPRVGIERQIFSEMVGRNKELDQLEIQVLKTINGEGSIVNIIGEAGIGKSRLMAELKNRDVMKRTTLLEGQGVSMGRNLSFHPIIDLLKHWARISEDDDETTAFNKLEIAVRRVHREEADEVIPFVATLMGMKLFGRYAERVKGIEGEALEKLVSKNIRELLIKGTEASPIVIIIEDLHWADTSSIELLEYLFSIVTTHRILFVNVFRPLHKETCHRIIQFLKDKFPEHYVEIKLQPLDEQMSECLINNMLNITWHHHSLIDQIVDRSGGNPFFIEEVVRSFIDIGAVIKKNGGFEVTDKIDTMVIPHTINDVLMARIDRLDENSRYVVKVASVIGRSFFYRILSEVARQIDDLDSRLSYLIEIQLIRDRMRIEELEYFFKHALAQEVAYESILHQKRKKIHLEVAKAIEKAFDKKLHEFYGILALHYIKGRDYERAELYLIKAGEEALRSSASNEALNYYQKGLDLYLNSNKDATDPERLAMFEKNIANALYNKCRWVEAVPHFNKVFEYWNIPIYPNKIVILIKFVKNIVTVVTGFDRPFIKQKPHPTQRDNEFFDLIYKRSSSLFYFDEIQMLFDALRTFNKVVKIDIARSTSAINIFIGTAGLLALGGLSFKIPRKLLHISNTQMDRKNIKNVMVYNFWDAVFNWP